MASTAMRSQRPTPREKKILRSLEVRLLGLSRDLGEALSLAETRPAAESGARRRLAFRPPVAAPSRRRRLRFAPLPPQADRLVVTNWNATPGLVCLGDVELELEPGQSAALWINRTAPMPSTESFEAEGADRAPAYTFAEGAAAPIL